MKRGSSLRFRLPKPIGLSVAAGASVVAMNQPSTFSTTDGWCSAAQRTDLTMFVEAVHLHEAGLDRVELAVLLESLDGLDLVAGGHRGEHRARLDRLAVHQDGADPAVARVAAPVGPGQAECVAQEVDEQQARLDVL